MHYVTNFDFRLLFIYTASLLGVYAIIGAVLTSNPKYIPLRGLSFATRLISCVVSTALLLLPATACSSFFNLVAIVPQQRAWLVVPLFLVSFAFFILVFAATNPAFFDLPEAGPKIVADWGVECASMTLAMFFRATYTKG
jgi:NADH:ubiquinone oxidoreductase subunit H